MGVGVQPRRGGGRGRGRDRSLANSPPFPAAYRRLGSSVCGAATILQMMDREARGSLVVQALLARQFLGSQGKRPTVERALGSRTWAWLPFAASVTAPLGPRALRAGCGLL